VAFLSGLFAFVTAGILWFGLAGINRGSNQIIILPISTVWWFTGIMAFLGFFLVENLLVSVLDKVLKIVKILFSIH
jgi:hypothetical protein